MSCSRLVVSVESSPSGVLRGVFNAEGAGGLTHTASCKPAVDYVTDYLRLRQDKIVQDAQFPQSGVRTS